MNELYMLHKYDLICPVNNIKIYDEMPLEKEAHSIMNIAKTLVDRAGIIHILS